MLGFTGIPLSSSLQIMGKLNIAVLGFDNICHMTVCFATSVQSCPVNRSGRWNSRSLQMWESNHL